MGRRARLRYLVRQGYVLLERNYRTRYGELDLILRHGNILVFVLGYKAIPEHADHLEGAVLVSQHARPEHLVDLVALVGGELVQRRRDHAGVAFQQGVPVPLELFEDLAAAAQRFQLPLGRLACFLQLRQGLV